MSKKADAAGSDQRLVVSAPKMQTVRVSIRGTSPYVSNRMSEESIKKMRDKQAEGSTSGTKHGARVPKDFEACYRGSRHISTDGWDGIPVKAFRAAMIDACRLVGYKMTYAKLSLFVDGDGVEEGTGVPLVKIIGTPVKVESVVTLQGTKTDIAARAMWREWSAVLSIRFDADQFTPEDVVNLLVRAGAQCGVGAGRANSKNSFGVGWGFFEVVQGAKTPSGRRSTS